eukprot:2131977-Rhodomonas_salina.1
MSRGSIDIERRGLGGRRWGEKGRRGGEHEAAAQSTEHRAQSTRQAVERKAVQREERGERSGTWAEKAAAHIAQHTQADREREDAERE